jgi:hypothetical protein
MGRPAVRDSAQTTTRAAFTSTLPATRPMVGREATRAARMSWAAPVIAKKTPKRTDTSRCSPITAKWIPAATAKRRVKAADFLAGRGVVMLHIRTDPLSRVKK